MGVGTGGNGLGNICPPPLLFCKIKHNRGIQNGGILKNILLFNTCRFSASSTTLSFFTFDSDINAPLTLSALSALSHCIVWMIASRKFMHNVRDLEMKFWLKNIGRMQKYFYTFLEKWGVRFVSFCVDMMYQVNVMSSL